MPTRLPAVNMSTAPFRGPPTRRDMLAWVHQSLASERELLMSLFGDDGGSSPPPGADAADMPHTAELLDRVFESICKPLQVPRKPPAEKCTALRLHSIALIPHRQTAAAGACLRTSKRSLQQLTEAMRTAPCNTWQVSSLLTFFSTPFCAEGAHRAGAGERATIAVVLPSGAAAGLLRRHRGAAGRPPRHPRLHPPGLPGDSLTFWPHLLAASGPPMPLDNLGVQACSLLNGFDSITCHLIMQHCWPVQHLVNPRL